MIVINEPELDKPHQRLMLEPEKRHREAVRCGRACFTMRTVVGTAEALGLSRLEISDDTSQIILASVAPTFDSAASVFVQPVVQ